MGSPVLMFKEKDVCNHTKQIEIAMARYIAALALLGAVLADGTGHHHTDHGAAAAPSAPSAGGYAAPAASYETPVASYGAPSYDTASYDAPATGYAEPSATGYADTYEQPSYGAADTVDGFDLSKILDLLPLFIAVFAAIILAQLLAPLFGVLFNAKVGLLGGILNPFGQAKLDIINAVLVPLGYQICNANGVCPATFPGGRSLTTLTTLNMDGEFTIMNALEIAEKLYGAYNEV